MKFRSVSNISPSARELIRRGRRGVGAEESGHARPRAGRTRLAQTCTQVHMRLRGAARRSARKSACGFGNCAPTCMQIRTRPPRLARRPWSAPWATPWSCQARRDLPPPRLWKLTGCGKLRATGQPPPDLPTTVGNPGLQPPPRDSHSYAPASATPREKEEKEENRKSTLLYICRASGLRGRLPPGHPRETRPP
jgi:hypothetical protein